MTAVDWEEVKRLAADFQRAQLTSTSQTLSERNCIEIINKLIELNLLDVVFTTDGKEYITPQYLLKEIKDELYINGGRINLVDLAHTLNVNLNHVAAKAAEIEKSTPGCTIVMGQLIDRSYVLTIAQEINEKLKISGQITVAELSTSYDLPSEFLQNIVESNLGKAIQAKQDKSDPRIFYTEAFVDRIKCVVKGALVAITRPTQVANILQVCDIQERDFYFAFENLMEDKLMSGVLTAKQGINTLFIPYVYTKQQNEWVDNFFKQNDYLEYDGLVRLGITEPVSFVRRHFPNGTLLELETCAVGPQLISQLQNAVEETLLTGSYLDVMMMLPSVFSTEDVTKVLEVALKRIKSKVNVHTFCDTVLVTDKFLQELMKPFHEKNIIRQKAEEVVSSGVYLQAMIEKKMAKSGKDDHEDSKAERREERRKKAATGKGGGGTQGRETKTKSLKKNKDRRGRGDADDSDDETSRKRKGGDDGTLVGKLDLFTASDIETVLSNEGQLADESEELISEIAQHLVPAINKAGADMASEIFEKNVASTAGSRRKYHAELQEKMDMRLTEVRLCEKGLKLLAGSELQGKLMSHLVKTVCTDLANALFTYVGQELCSRPANQEVTTNEMRAKILTEVPPDARDPLVKFHKTLAGSSVEDFLSAVEPAFAVADLAVRKPDKKKDKAFLSNHRELLLTNLSQCEDNPALILHMVVLVLFQAVTQNVIHASGKFVPAIIDFLKHHLPEQEYTALHQFQDLVLKMLTTNDDAELQSKLKAELNEKTNFIRETALHYKHQHFDKS